MNKMRLFLERSMQNKKKDIFTCWKQGGNHAKMEKG